MKWLAAIVIGGVVALVSMAYFIGAGAPPEELGECNVTGEGVQVNVANLPKAVGPYSGKQLENAALIINAGKKLGLNKHGQTIGVMTAIGESTLNNINRGDAVGPDSRGLFQQRDNGAWGTLEERMDPTTAATSFFKALLKVQGWESLAPTLAASRVQGNADPFHYAPHWNEAVEIVDKLADAKIVQASDGEAVDPQKTIAKYNLGPVREVTARAVGTLAPQFKIKTVGGHRDSDPYPDHPSGLAADFMVSLDGPGRAKGDRLASHLTEHAEEFGVDYILWQQRSWYPGQGWKPMADRGSPTANHADHVHVTFKGTKGSGALPAVSACSADEASLGDGGGGSRVIPAKGPITSGFGPRNAGVAGASRNHKGTDFGTPCGGSIVATSPGRVVFAGPMSGYGHMIEVDHGNGTRTRYAHMFSNGMLTRVGDKVKGGQEIAKVGNDGVSGGCHLHFEVLIKDNHVDPQTWLTQGKKS